MEHFNSDEALEVTGLDLGDRFSYFCDLDASGEIKRQGRAKTDAEGLRRCFQGRKRRRVAIENGTHSRWVQALLLELGHEAVVADPRRVRLIWASGRKNDRLDAQRLAQLGRSDVRLLWPIRHRGLQAQADLGLIKSRDLLVRQRSGLINAVRGTVKSAGGRLPSCSAEGFARRSGELIPVELRESLWPLLRAIEGQSAEIAGLERRIAAVSAERYADECARLRQVAGVGPLTSLAFVLTLEDPGRLARSREAGAWAGLVPRQQQSGERDRQLPISKQGDGLLRRLLVQCAHYILRSGSPDCDLKRFGQRLIERGGGAAKKRAAVAVARKLAVLLHRLWVSAQAYEPLYNADRLQAQAS